MSTPTIISTIGQTTASSHYLRELITAGTEIFRYNFAQGLDLNVMKERFDSAYDLISNQKSCNIKIMADLPYPGAKVRLGEFPEYKYFLEKDTIYTLKSGSYTEDINNYIPVQYSCIGNYCRHNDVIIIGDGELAFKVIDIVNDSEIRAKTISQGYILCLKAIHFGKTQLQSISNIEKYVHFLAEYKPGLIALSFVENAEEINSFRQHFESLFCDLNWHPNIFSKIETQKGVDNINNILLASDGIMIGRGDLGLNIKPTRFGIIQNRLIDACKVNNIPVYVASQIIESLVTSYIPKRSEICDLTTLICKNVEGIVLASETSGSTKAAEIVNFVKSTILEVAMEYIDIPVSERYNSDID